MYVIRALCVINRFRFGLTHRWRFAAVETWQLVQLARGVRGLRVTGNAIKGMAILSGGSPTH